MSDAAVSDAAVHDASGLTLYSYWRSSAAWRVRLALAWKRLDHRIVPVDLLGNGHLQADYLAMNPQGLLPLLVDNGTALAQSLAIIEYLDEMHPDPPLLPGDAVGRARVRAAAQMIGCDTHPLNNLRVLRYLKGSLGQAQPEIDGWVRHWIGAGLAAVEAFAAEHGGQLLFGDRLSLADICLVPQMYNARRFGADLSGFANLVRIDAAVSALPVLAPAHPDRHAGAG